MADPRAQKYRAIIDAAAKENGLPVELVESVIHTESRFNPNAVSRVGAQGLMQLMPETAAGLGVTDPFDPEQNIRGGARYLKQQLDEFGTEELALAAYNAGPHNVRKHGGVPPFAETQAYVRKILGREPSVPTGGAPSNAPAVKLPAKQTKELAKLSLGLPEDVANMHLDILREGPSVQTPEEREFEDRPIESGLLGAARGLTLGVSDPILTALDIYDPEELRKLKEHNETASVVGEVGSLLVPGAGAIGAVGKAARLARLGRVGAGIAEGAAIGLGHAISEDAMGTPGMNAERYLSHVGYGAVTGGVLSAVGAGASKALDAATKKAFPLLVERAAEGNINRRLIRELAESKGITESQALEEVTARFRAIHDGLKAGTLTQDAAFKDAGDFLVRGQLETLTQKGIDTGLEAAGGAAVASALGATPGVGAAIGALGGRALLRGAGRGVVGSFLDSAGVAKVIDKAAQTIVSGGEQVAKRAQVVRAATLASQQLLTEPKPDESEDDALERLTRDLDDTVDPAVLDRALTPTFDQLSTHAPGTSIALRDRVLKDLAFLRSRLPRPASRAPMMSGLRARVSRSELRRFASVLRAVTDRLGVLDDAASGRLDVDAIRALEQTSPEMFAELRSRIAEGMVKHQGTLDYRARRNIQRITGGDLEPSFDRNVVAFLQAPPVEPEEGKEGSDIELTSERSRSQELEGRNA